MTFSYYTDDREGSSGGNIATNRSYCDDPKQVMLVITNDN